MSDPIDYILASLRRAADNAYPWSLTPHEAGVVVAEIERMRAERRMDNADLAQAYDFARNKGEALERQAVVAWLRGSVCGGCCAAAAYALADTIERGEHRVVEGAVEDETEAEQRLRAEAFGADLERGKWEHGGVEEGAFDWDLRGDAIRSDVTANTPDVPVAVEQVATSVCGTCRDAERAAAVAFLRGLATNGPHGIIATAIADAFEQGNHTKERE